MVDNESEDIRRQALLMHERYPQGKICMDLTKPLETQYDLSLAYTPGVAAPCIEIHQDPDTVFKYTARGNLVAVVTNGTAVLGLGNIGALAAKPVMEGKAALFKRFADIDAVDIEVKTENIDEFVNAIRYLEPSWGGINLEDIKAPECFIIERRLQELMNIPVFHDDQHGTAIVAAAGLLNAVQLTNRKLEDVRLVVNGAGAAAIACTNLLIKLGISKKNVIMCDRSGVIYQGRKEGMNEWKVRYAVETNYRTLAEAVVGADVFLGLSSKGALSQNMVVSMKERPIIFAMSNPDPEITPDDVYAVCPDAIVATGRSDYKNQINNVMGFPYIFRGALDVRATCVNDEMKIAAVHTIAQLAQLDIPEEVKAVYGRQNFTFGPQYIVPTPFDKRLMQLIPPKVAEAAIRSGVARRMIVDFEDYAKSLVSRMQRARVNM